MKLAIYLNESDKAEHQLVEIDGGTELVVLEGSARKIGNYAKKHYGLTFSQIEKAKSEVTSDPVKNSPKDLTADEQAALDKAAAILEKRAKEEPETYLTQPADSARFLQCSRWRACSNPSR